MSDVNSKKGQYLQEGRKDGRKEGMKEIKGERGGNYEPKHCVKSGLQRRHCSIKRYVRTEYIFVAALETFLVARVRIVCGFILALVPQRTLNNNLEKSSFWSGTLPIIHFCDTVCMYDATYVRINLLSILFEYLSIYNISTYLSMCIVYIPGVYIYSYLSNIKTIK